jgi:hypothetical protein
MRIGRERKPGGDSKAVCRRPAADQQLTSKLLSILLLHLLFLLLLLLLRPLTLILLLLLHRIFCPNGRESSLASD